MVERKTKDRTFEVLISFNGLDKGERFTQEGADLGWAMMHVENGYLRDVTDEPTVLEAQASQASQASPTVPEDRVEEARRGSEVGQG